MGGPRRLFGLETLVGRYHIALAGVTLLALALRLARLTFQPLWWDEGWSVYFAAEPVARLLALTSVDIHPPLYYLLLRAWSLVFGFGVVSLRLLSVFVGTATVPLLFAAGRRLAGRPAGLLAAGLLALSPLHVYYSQEVRMYGLVTLLALAAWLLAETWTAAAPGPRRRRLWLGYVLAAAAALYTQYYAALLLLALNLVVLARADRRDRPAWLGAQLAVLALYLPWLWYAGPRLLTYVRFKVGVEADRPLGLFDYLARRLAAFHLGHAEGGLAGAWWLGLLPPALLLLALAVAWWTVRRGPGQAQATRPSFDDGLLRRQRSPRTTVRGSEERRTVVRREQAGGHFHSSWRTAGHSISLVTITLLCGFALNLALPFNPSRGERLLLLALPADLLLLAGGLVALWRLRARVLAAGITATLLGLALLSLTFFYTVPRYPADDYRPVVARVQALGRAGDAVLCVHPWQVGYFRAYLAGAGQAPALVLTPRQVLPRERQLWAGDPARLAAGLDDLLADHPRLWLADHQAMGRVLEAQIEAYLVDRAYPTLSEWHGENTVLSLFATGRPADRSVSATLGGWLALEGAALDPGPLQAGWDVVPVELTWRLAGQPQGDMVVGLRLVGAGQVWAQRDAPPRAGLSPFATWPVGQAGTDRHGLLVPAGTPPGDYWLTLRVYDAAGLTVLPATFPGGSGGEVALGVVRVVRPQPPPPVAALPIDRPLDVRLDVLRLLGADVAAAAREPLLPGEAVAVDLFWQALAAPGQDLLPRLRLVADDGQVVAELVEKPVAGIYPTAWWQAGELVRDPHALPVPAAARPGRYRLVLDLVRAAGGAAIQPPGGPLDLGAVEVLGREHATQPPAAGHRQPAAFGPAVELWAHDLPGSSPLLPGETLTVTLYWHALQTPDRNYHSFVHVLDDRGLIVAQHDGPPGGGRLPSLGWLPGEYLADPHPLSLPAGLPAGSYQLVAGLYDPLTGERPGPAVRLTGSIAVHSPDNP